MANMQRSSSNEGGLTCAVCMEVYNEEENRPLMLPACGHTFCKLCLVGVVTREAIKGQFLCPTCRRPQPLRAVEDLPSNYSLLELTRQESVTSTGSPSNRASLSMVDKAKAGEQCSEHRSRLAFWCTTCEVAACGECLFEGHPRPEHNLVKVDDHLTKLQELMNIRSTRIVTQLVSASEENITKVKDAFVDFVELLRQRRALNKLLDQSRQVKSIAKIASDLGSLSSVNETLRSLEKEFKNSHIDSEVTVTVQNPLAAKSSKTGKAQVISSPAMHTVKTEDLIDLQATPSTSTAVTSSPSDNSPPSPGVIASFPTALEEPISIPPSIGVVSPSPKAIKPSPAPKPPLLARPAIIPKPKVALPSATPITLSSSTVSQTHASKSEPNVYGSPNAHVPQSNISSSVVEKISVSTQTSPPFSSPEPLHSLQSEVHENNSQSKNKKNTRVTQDTPSWPSMLCGTLSGNWTASKITLEPRGIHVYSLEPMKDKCDVFLNFSVVSSLAPTQYPTVFMDLQDGSRPLGRVYITLQIDLRRAQQFFSLCLGDRGPSYLGSFFHSVHRRGDPGEGLGGGDYEKKAGKGGSAVLYGLDPNKEIAKRCERGMVSRLTAKSETSAQFCITVRDGPRTKTVFPFGRVCQGISVVEEACRRPALSVTIANCGCVLPLQ